MPSVVRKFLVCSLLGFAMTVACLLEVDSNKPAVGGESLCKGMETFPDWSSRAKIQFFVTHDAHATVARGMSCSLLTSSSLGPLCFVLLF